MNIKEQFNSWMNMVEERCLKEPEKDLALRIAALAGKSYRDLNTIFGFLTGKNLGKYIHERRLMVVYRSLLQFWPEYSMQDAVEDSGYENQDAFSKGFSAQFGIRPIDVAKGKDASRYREPLSWDSLEQDAAEPAVTTPVEWEKADE